MVTVCFLLHFHLLLKLLTLLGTNCIWRNIKNGKNGHRIQKENSKFTRYFQLNAPKTYYTTQKIKQYVLKISFQFWNHFFFFQFSEVSLVYIYIASHGLHNSGKYSTLRVCSNRKHFFCVSQIRCNKREAFRRVFSFRHSL